MKLERLTVGPYGTNCYIFSDDTRACWIIDPGYDGQRIIDQIVRQDLTPQAILLTHSHWDHVMALPALRGIWPTLPVLVHQMDAQMLGPSGGLQLLQRVQRIDIRFARDNEPLFSQLPEATGFLTDGQQIAGCGFTVIHTPGHTPGSVSFYHESGAILLSGDTLFAGGIGRTDLPGGNHDQIVESIRRLLALPGLVRVFPGHGASTAIESERTNPWI
ncbi:MAG: MBL fold metallo-hydrolase [Sphaerochaetaceae bacterium]|jgi:hydroxyacylglutathione hydrolase